MGHRPVVMQLVAGTRHISVTGMAHFVLVSIILAVITGEQAAGKPRRIGKNSLTCLSFDKPFVNQWGGIKAAQDIWLKNSGVEIRKNCGLDRDCGSFRDGSKIEIPFFQDNDFFDLSISLWLKRRSTSGCWSVLASSNNCSGSAIQMTSLDDTHLMVMIRDSLGLTYMETYETAGPRCCARNWTCSLPLLWPGLKKPLEIVPASFVELQPRTVLDSPV
ncbi:hypothetical protein LSAT2_027034 [Lamellibrachia satsuma]|nr:hypothetical protein LSAT2_027034 [Lamellibrachia satsuma]